MISSLPRAIETISFRNSTTPWTTDSVRTKGAIFFMKRIIHQLFNESSIKTATFSHAFFYLSPERMRNLSNNSIALAGEFAVLSQLTLYGYDANMTLGNTKRGA